MLKLHMQPLTILKLTYANAENAEANYARYAKAKYAK